MGSQKYEPTFQELFIDNNNEAIDSILSDSRDGDKNSEEWYNDSSPSLIQGKG